MIERLGDRAIRFARPAVSARALVEAIRAWPAGVVDVIVAREDVAVTFARPDAPALRDLVGLAERIAALSTLHDDAISGREHVLRVVYDGEDLEAVAGATGLGVAEVIERHAARTYAVAMMGFLPGFGYLDGLDPALSLPRRATPRPRVPRGALAIAGTQTAIYPFASPGGWHLLGRVVEATLFDERGAMLALGDRVRFER